MPASALPFADFEAASFLEAFGLTLRLALTTTLGLLLLGVPLAHWLNTSRLPGVGFIQTLVGLPIVLPPTVLGFYLLITFAPARSPDAWWPPRWLGGKLSFTFTGLVIGSVLYSLPYAVQSFQTGLAGVPGPLVEAAAASGAAPWRTFWRVRVPLARRGLLTGMALSFAHTVGEFGVVVMLGGNIPGKTRVASIALYDAVERGDYATAHLYAVTLLVISGLLLSLVTWLQRRAPG